MEGFSFVLFAFSSIFWYHRIMKKLVLLICLFFPFLSSAEESGGFGEALSTDFYSQIERWNYTIQQKLINTRLKEYKDTNDFISKCGINTKMKPGVPLSKILDDNGTVLAGITSSVDAKNLTTDALIVLLRCINDTYAGVQASAVKQGEDMRKIASIGIYTDGTTDNSDYDIISDIAKIDGIIFTEKIPYNGTKNIGKLSLFDLLSNNVPLLNPPANALPNMTYANSFSGLSTASGSTPITVNFGENLATWWCGTSDPIPFSNPDGSLLSEIASLTTYGAQDIGSNWVWGMYANRVNPIATPRSRPTTPEKADFFHSPNCASFFCIDIKMIPGTMNLLWWGNSYAIESLLNKRYKEINEISQFDLTAKHMSTNFFENITKGLFKGSGLKTALFERPQRTQVLKTEERPEEVMDRLWRCAASTAGLSSTEMIQSNSFTAWAYMNKEWSDTKTLGYRKVQINPTDEDLLNQSKTCIENEITLARKDYSSSFSTDLNEIQAFSNQIINSIQSTISLVDRMEKKPSEK